MIEVVRSVEAYAAPERVWAVLSAFGDIVDWAPNVDHSCLLAEPGDGVGAVRRIQTGRTTVVERVTVWEPPTALAYELEGLPPVVKEATNTWQVHGTADGSRVAIISRVQPGPRPPHQLAARAVVRMLAKASDQMLAGLVTRVVAGERAST